MDRNFYAWAIPKYFTFNYMDSHFHELCGGDCSLWVAGEHFIQHLTSYLTNAIQFGGKWIQQFVLQSSFLERILHQAFNQPHLKDYQKLISALKLDNSHLLFIAFLGKFFYSVFAQHHSGTSKIQLISSLNQLYFRYRIELSLNNNVDIGQPPQVLNLLGLISKNRQIMCSDSKGKLELLRQIAKECQFSHLLQRIINEDVFQIKNQAPKKPRQKLILKDPTKETKFESKYFKDIIQSGSLQKQVVYLEQFKKQQKQELTPEIVKKEIQKKMHKRQQTASKITKTTRFPNFKGIFTKKLSLIQGYIHNPYQEDHKNANIQKKEQMVKKKSKTSTEAELQDNFNFLCDKSF